MTRLVAAAYRLLLGPSRSGGRNGRDVAPAPSSARIDLELASREHRRGLGETRRVLGGAVRL